jgi:hypothetical protein
VVAEHAGFGPVADADAWVLKRDSVGIILPNHMVYLTTTDPRGAMGLGGIQEVPVASWQLHHRHRHGLRDWQGRLAASLSDGLSRSGRWWPQRVLTTAGKLLFAGDPTGSFVAYNPANGTPVAAVDLDQLPVGFSLVRRPNRAITSPRLGFYCLDQLSSSVTGKRIKGAKAFFSGGDGSLRRLACR